MKSSVEKSSDTRVKLTVEVPFSELSQEIDAAYKRIAQQVEIPGFRKGKAPRAIIDARFGRATVMQEVIHDVLPKKHVDAIEETGMSPLGSPDVELTNFELNEGFEFTSEFEVRPEFDLPDFAEFAVEVDAIDPDGFEDKVNERLEAMRERLVEWEDVDRPAAEGDKVHATVTEVSTDAEGVEGDKRSDDVDVVLEGPDSSNPVHTLLTGARANETVRHEVENNGVKTHFEGVVTSVKQKKLPELDDEFAEFVSPFDTFDELKADLLKQIEEEAKAGQAAQIRDTILEKALSTTEFPVPEGAVQDHVNNQMDQMRSQVNGDDKVFAQLLELQGLTKDEFIEKARVDAEKAVRTQLFLDKLAEEVNPEVYPNEVIEHVNFLSKSFRMKPEHFLNNLDSAQVTSLWTDVKRGKALAEAICKSTVTDTKGEPVDVEKYFGEENEDTEDEQQVDESQTTSAPNEDEN